MAKHFGYARVSSTDQSVDIQVEALRNRGIDDALIFSERISGTSRDGRTELARVLALLREGDTLTVTRLDRLGRSLKDLADIAHEIDRAGAHLVVTEQSVDTSTAAGRAFFGMLATFAQFETDIRRERQAEGIFKARQRGLYKGRKPSVDRARVLALRAAGMGPAAIARELRIGEASVYRVLKEGASNVVPMRA
jgi:DNA invertase Pin-like site-specific DNA recombinase